MSTDDQSQEDYGLAAAAAAYDPYPAYARIREEAPVHYNPLWQGWIVSRYADVAAAFRHPGLSANRMGAYSRVLPPPMLEKVAPLIRNLGSWVLMMDPPGQSRVRSLLAGAFTPRFIEGLRPRISAAVDRLLDAVAGQASFDVIESLAYPLPVQVIGDMLGLPPEDGERLKGWSDALATFLGVARIEPQVVAAAVRAVVEMEMYFTRVIEARRQQPGDDLVSLMVQAHDQEGRLSDQELLSSCVAILFGGHETTTNLIGNAVHLLLKNPEQLARLRADPSLIDTAVEEVMRYEAPVQRMGRVSVADVELSGATIPAGNRVYLVMAAANRDPGQFADADAFDVGRKENRHLALGIGVHYCLGAALGRLEAKIALTELLRRFPGLALDPAEAPVWIDNITIRGLKKLPVLTGEAAAAS
ncbi:MAG: cytochrome P450 [Myxococcales bacterium]|nr:cytochrome P450 [Myxococcales bacterium]MCB9705544.1 cytochrome P450 [Myxococcales bacterium]